MNYYEEISKTLPPPVGNMVGDKTDGYEERLAEARRITELMQTRRPFCFLRLGDGELEHFLIAQDNLLDQFDASQYGDGPVAGTQHGGNSGLGPKHTERLWKVYEQADYVDFHERNWPIGHLVGRLKLTRKPGTERNPSKKTSVIVITWVERELKTYCRGRRIGFVGAEARLLELLSKTAEFKKAAKDYWPDEAEVFFHQARNDGRNLDANLDLIKEDLRDFVSSNKLDTIFISLGSGAKILGFELSRELGICCFDFGAMTRGLTYSGCDGNRAARSPHYPFFYRLSFGVYMDALEQAFPKLTREELLAKAHGQLILELVKKEAGWTFASWEFDFNSENKNAFRTAHHQYLARYRHLFDVSPTTKKERADFLHFCGTHGLTTEGHRFMLKFKVKKIARQFLDRLRGKPKKV